MILGSSWCRFQFFGPPEGLPFPQFGKTLEEGETQEPFLEHVEVSARRIIIKMTELEYLAGELREVTYRALIVFWRNSASSMTSM